MRYRFDAEDGNNAFITIVRDAEYKEGGVLSGIPVAVKDNISTKGIPTTCGSKILEGYVPPYDAHAVAMIKEAGAVIVGKTNMDEFGMGTTTFSGIIGGGDGKAFPASLREEIQAQMRGASMPVIQGKGGTVFGPAYHISNLIDAVIRDRKEVIPCSCVLDGEYGLHDLSICVPARIGRSGVEEIVERPLDE